MLEVYENNPWYWQWQGKPFILAGASDEDNLFQIDNLVDHLEQLHEAGGNYIRCTLSSRDPGDEWPFGFDRSSKLYDLTSWNRLYWSRLEQLLELSKELQIFVQLELWDRFDYSRDPWQLNPFNPACNCNYTDTESGLKPVIISHPGEKENAFFRSVPGLENNGLILAYQERFIDKVLSITLEYDHILYCMDNETNESPKWGAYWNGYIKAAAGARGKSIHTTEMWDPHDLTDPMHKRTWEYPDKYSFIDISQGNHQCGRHHWDRIIEMKQMVDHAGFKRPVNMVKIYGANTGRFGTTRDAVERFWRAALAGVGAFRFHRPEAGQGLSKVAVRCLRSLREITARVPLWDGCPGEELLSNCSWNEAYCRRSANGEAPSNDWFLVFFCDGGTLSLDTQGVDMCTLLWLDILACEWSSPKQLQTEKGVLVLETPEIFGFYLAFVKGNSNRK